MRTSHFRWVQAAPDAPAGEERWKLTAAPVVTKEDKPVTPMPVIDLPLEPREQAVVLLTAAAEIEHALMVQYLYAAYSLRVPPQDAPADADVAQWKRILIQIAREEMAHLASVENLLRLIGGPLNFEREQSPYRSGLYPFRFRLERCHLTLWPNT
jgi:hypothetical protein